METESIKEKLSKAKGLGIVAGIILIILGITMCFFPIMTGEVILWLFFAGMIVYGIYAIIQFIIQKKGEKNGWLLASGILMIVFSVLAVLTVLINAEYLQNQGEAHPLYESNAFVLFLIFVFLGFWAMFNGIFKLCTIGRVQGPQKGWTIAASICDIAIGTMMVIFPSFGTYVIIMIAFAIYMIALGIMVIVGVTALSDKAKKVIQPEEKKEDDVKTVDATKK